MITAILISTVIAVIVGGIPAFLGARRLAWWMGMAAFAVSFLIFYNSEVLVFIRLGVLMGILVVLFLAIGLFFYVRSKLKGLHRMWLMTPFLLLTTPMTEAQVLATAETLGKGRQAVLLSDNMLYIDDVDLNIGYAQYVRGLADNFDLYCSAGETWILGENQTWVSVGGNWNLWDFRRMHLSLFNIVSSGMHRRHDASTVLLNSAVIVSWKASDAVSIYSGVNGLFPIGGRARGLFTPPQEEINLPLGIAIFQGRFSFFAEADIGHLTAVGTGIGASF